MASKPDIVYRFTVGKTGGPTSSVWRLWFNSKEKDGATSDVYFSYRFLGGKLKLSIHESGEIHYSLTGELAKELDIRNQQRHIDKWKVSYKDPIFKVIVPYTELRLPVRTVKGNVDHLPTPKHNHAIEIYLYITLQSLKELLPDQFSMLMEETLANGNTISLIWRDNPITESNKELYLSGKAKVRQFIKDKETSGDDLRAYLFVNNQEIERGFIDLAI